MARKPSLYTLIGIVSACIFPMIISGYLYLTHWQPSHLVNKGILMTPPMNLSHTPLHHTPSLHQKALWQVIYVTDYCSATCRHTQAQLNKVYRALGNKNKRIQITWVTQTPLKHATAHVHTMTTSSTQRLRWFPDHKKHPIYIMDPRGDVMLKYTIPLDNKSIYTDIKKLLKYSRIG